MDKQDVFDLLNQLARDATPATPKGSREEFAQLIEAEGVSGISCYSIEISFDGGTDSRSYSPAGGLSQDDYNFFRPYIHDPLEVQCLAESVLVNLLRPRSSAYKFLCGGYQIRAAL